MKLSEELAWRGFVNQTTLKSTADLDQQKFSFYWGVDPSAPSMQVGNLAAAMMVRHFMNYGHKAYLLIGGATGLIGDPDGKKEERTLKPVEEIEANKRAIVDQYRNLFAEQDFEVVDNIEWFQGIGYLDFLRDVGKHVPMRQMLGRDFVQTRLGEGGAGISYAEFSYVLIQAYDFLHLHKNNEVNLQVCGSDQWGNSIAGVDLIRRLTGKETHVWSVPLVINKTTGQKFGKSEAGAIWLDENLTSVYQFYQFWLNIDDEGVVDYLKIFTFLSKDEVEVIEQQFTQDKPSRVAQKTLAYEVTKLVHGEARAQAIRRACEAIFGTGAFLDLSHDEIELLKNELPVVRYKDEFHALAVDAGLADSLSDARRLDAQQAFSLNGQKTSAGAPPQFTQGYNLLQRGKNKVAIIDNNRLK